jgi:YD repeat-containing protein
MKRITQRLIVVMSLFLVATACNKTVSPAPKPAPAPTPTNSALSKMEVEGDTVKISYNSDGTIQKVVSQPPGNGGANTYVFSYENGKLKEVNFSGKWKYTYNGEQLIKVETINTDGKTKYQSNFSYVNNRVDEIIEYRVTDIFGLLPKSKTKFQYYANGNVSKKELFQYINSDWLKSEDVLILEYDNKVNTGDRFENLPLIPNIIFAQNNPLREKWLATNGNIDSDVEHQYVYDTNGRPLSKKTLYKSPGFPDISTEVKYHY